MHETAAEKFEKDQNKKIEKMCSFNYNQTIFDYPVKAKRNSVAAGF